MEVGYLSKRDSALRLIMLGAPGAGKGTQADNISEEYGIPHISTGDIFRANIKGGTELGKEVKKYLDSGGLVPDELTVKIVEDRLNQSDCDRGFVLDGFPRTIYQAEMLDSILESEGKRVTAAINIRVSDGDLVERLSGRRVCRGCGKSSHIKYAPQAVDGVCDICSGELFQREDDAPEVVLSRLEAYHAQTEPLIEFYREKGVFLEILGKEEIADTTRDMFAVLEKI